MSQIVGVNPTQQRHLHKNGEDHECGVQACSCAAVCVTMRAVFPLTCPSPWLDGKTKLFADCRAAFRVVRIEIAAWLSGSALRPVLESDSFILFL